MTRGLHPHTRLQRAKTQDDSWRLADGDSLVERRGPPPGSVAKAIAAVFATLLLCMAGVALLLTVLERRAPIDARTSAQRFRSAGPPLLADPARSLRQERASHATPDGIDHAMRTVVNSGWAEPMPPPSRAETAIARVKAGT